MKRLSILLVAALLLSLPRAVSGDKIEHHVSTELSREQIAVYSFILHSYRTLLNPTYRDMLAHAFYLEEETSPLDISHLTPSRACLKGLDLEQSRKSAIPTVHNLFSNQRWLPPFVKPASGAKCKDVAVSKPHMCWETEGALSFTEIVFDRRHTHALVGFSVGCGMECGWGELIVLERVDGHWRDTKNVCKEWYI